MTYRKWGRVVRWENGVVVRVDEAGEAIDGDVFDAHPIDARIELPDLALPDVPRLTNVERLIVSEGVAVHECGGIRWSERTRRIHVSLAKAPHRATLDLAEFDFDLLRRIDLDATPREFGRIRLAPHVFASFLPSLEIDKEQMAGDHDGRGRSIERRRVEGDPPNIYRPSYRVRPIAAWMNVRAIPFGTIDRDAPEAIARLADGLLVVHEGKSFVARPRIEVKAVGESERWYPYAAGAFGAEAMI